MSRIANQDLVIAGVFNSIAPILTSGQVSALQTDVNGNLFVNLAAGGGSGGTSSAFNAAFPATGTAVGATDGANMKPLTVDASGFLKVNVSAGSSGNAAASATGAAVPVDADYQGVNIGGNLVGVTGLALGGTTKATTVAIVDGSGNQITTFGGGTQFPDNAASGATPTGTLSMGWDSVNSKIRALKVDASQNLLVAGSFASALIPDRIQTGNITNTQSITVSCQGGSAIGIQVTGTWGGTLSFEQTVDGITWNPANCKQIPSSPIVQGTTVNGEFSHPAGGINSFRVRGNTVTSGTAVITLEVGAGVFTIQVTNLVAADLLATVSQGGLWNINQAIGVAGFEKITDGTNTAVVKAANIAPVTGDTALVVAISPNTPTLSVSLAANQSVNLNQIGGAAVTLGVKTSANSIPVVLASDEATLPVSIAATVNVSVQNASIPVTQSTSPWVVSLASTTITGTVSTKTPLTPLTPSFSSVGVASATAVASNANRKGLILINTSSNNVSLGFGVAAILNSGVTLSPYGTYVMDEFDFSIGLITAIASAASSNLAIQEFST